ncbi:MAG: 23S rRNA (pseudouridine(1915)-N(3))-methyltransferase RlmH [Bryobacteraceae bacterium]
MKIFLYYIGKARDPHANAMAGKYIKRSTRFAKCEMREIDPRKFDPWQKHPSAQKILLDPAGNAFDSAEFAHLVNEGRDLIFVLGGADGLPPGWREKADLLLSLSPMTMPHELARAVLAEQIYRALATLRGHPYPR